MAIIVVGFAGGSRGGNGDGRVPFSFLCCGTVCGACGGYNSCGGQVTSWMARQEASWNLKKQIRWAFLWSKPLPPCRGLPFFPDLHSEVSRSWGKPYSSCLFSPSFVDYSNVSGLNERGYRVMPRVEQTLASYLSPGVASSLKAPALPTKPLHTTSALVGRGYTVSETAGSDGSSIQSNTFWPAAHETPTVVAQDQGVFPEEESASHDQGHAMMLSCLRHVEETLVLVTRLGVGSSLSCNANDRCVPHWLGCGY